jgi:hypothetical protein
MEPKLDNGTAHTVRSECVDVAFPEPRVDLSDALTDVGVLVGHLLELGPVLRDCEWTPGPRSKRIPSVGLHEVGTHNGTIDAEVEVVSDRNFHE